LNTSAAIEQQLLDVYQEDASAGFRLDYFEAYNWGTFHERIGHAKLDGQTALLTGENGAGKSTLADGIVTLLVPTNKRNYNAASSDAKRERSESDYIRGNIGNTYNELSERDEPVYLRRDGEYYTVLLGVFRNRRDNKAITLAQILWIKSNGDTAKLFIIETRALTIADDLAGFSSIAGIKETLKKERDIETIDKFQAYSEKFHRFLRLNADRNPMDIFNQTVAVKDIKNLTQFIRDYMLEGGSAEELFASLKERVRELRTTHAMILTQKEQLAELESVSKHVSKFRAATETRIQLERERDALDAFFAQTALRLREARSIQNVANIETLTGKRDNTFRQKETTAAALTALRERQKSSEKGSQIASLESEIEMLGKTVELLQKNRKHFDALLETLHPNRRVDSFSAYATFQAQLPAQLLTLTGQSSEFDAKEHAQERRVIELQQEFEKNDREIGILIKQHTSIDGEVLERRDLIADMVKIPRKNLPFVGELIRVQRNETRWTGAIESLLRGFALTILVHHDNYKEVDAFVSANRMRGRVEYFPVPIDIPSPGTKPNVATVAGKMEIKPDAGGFGRYILRELIRRFDHLCCETTDSRWHDADQALTITGLFKGKTGRRVKDDRHDINDRRNWILGWYNHDKLTLIRARQKELAAQGEKATKDYQAAKNAKENHRKRLAAAQNLIEAGFTFDQINPTEMETAIAAKQTQRDILKRDPALAQLSGEIAIAAKDLKEKNKAYEGAVSALAVAENDETKNLEEIERLKNLTASQPPELEDLFILIRERSPEPIKDIEGIDNKKATLHRLYTDEIGTQTINAGSSTNDALAKMAQIGNHEGWNHLHDELGSSPPEHLNEATIERFQRVEMRIRLDDIPKNEEKFKRLLQENVISDFNTFRTSLEHMEQTIITRITQINTHLSKVDFDRREGLQTYIRLIPEKTKDLIVRDFRVQLHGALKDILNIDEDLEARETVFHQVNALIEDVDKDPKRRSHIIDVRNWFDFKAEERFRSPDKPKETYQGAIGKSGGEKSRLASTILATAIAYQYDIEIDRPEGDTFRFVLIDEALSRIGDEFSAYLFEIFSRFHLQLLIIHPRDAKLHITEKFVRRYNVALKPERFSSVVNMTVHEFQEYKNRFAAA
jgi:uncharacterized protein YPO0396